MLDVWEMEVWRREETPKRVLRPYSHMTRWQREGHGCTTDRVSGGQVVLHLTHHLSTCGENPEKSRPGHLHRKIFEGQLTFSAVDSLLLLPSKLIPYTVRSVLRLRSILSRWPLSLSSLTPSWVMLPACLCRWPSTSRIIRMYSQATAHRSRKLEGGKGTHRGTWVGS